MCVMMKACRSIHPWTDGRKEEISGYPTAKDHGALFSKICHVLSVGGSATVPVRLLLYTTASSTRAWTHPCLCMCALHGCDPRNAPRELLLAAGPEAHLVSVPLLDYLRISFLHLLHCVDLYVIHCIYEHIRSMASQKRHFLHFLVDPQTKVICLMDLKTWKMLRNLLFGGPQNM